MVCFMDHIMSPQNLYVEVLAFSTSGCDYICKELIVMKEEETDEKWEKKENIKVAWQTEAW